MKLVIADDESLVRYTLRSMINEMEAPWQIVGESSNGEELMDLLAEHQPNVAIVDIRMPKMNGLDAIRLGRTKSPLTKWIVLSGYSDFQYAQEALKLGVSQYMLKPVSAADLESALFDTYRDNKELMILHNQQYCNHLSALSNGLISIEQRDTEGIIHHTGFIGAVILFDAPHSEERNGPAPNEFYKQIHHTIHNHLIYGINMALYNLPSGELTVVGAWDPERNGEGRQQVHGFFDRIAELAGQFPVHKAIITVYETEETAGFKEMNDRLLQLQQWKGLRTVCGIGGRVMYEAVKQEAQKPEKLAVGLLVSAAQQHIQDRMYLGYQNSLNELEQLLTQSSLLAYRESRCALHLFILHSLDIDLTAHSTGPGVVRELRQYGERLLREQSNRDNPPTDLAQQVIQYIDMHYKNDIGIAQIAALLNVSSNYLSTVFHKKTGVTFIKYLTRIRMNKAGEMLLNTNLQIKQIAEEVGYFSTRHFTKLFTEAFERYPSDYRKMSKT
ncbi:response regulator [Paenibacillus solisilvae]|uniref:Response regulator n=1 Tax=Paenibacillus solisilvae TaxID=2486751 RepID=A0ABW0VTU7_9BACL